MSSVRRDNRAGTQGGDDLGYMSDMALQLAQMAEHSGLATLAYLFRMAALEASTVDGGAAEADRARQLTPH